jgi:hypothetical protein
MFGKMNVEKALKFYTSSFPYKTFVERVVSGNYETSFGEWSRFDSNIHTLFSRRYNLRLSVEQRWFIFISIIDFQKVNIDEALSYFLKGGLRDVGFWAVKKGSDLILKNTSFEEFNKMSGFPSNDLFIYSINNHQTIYPRNENINNFLSALEIYKNTLNSNDIIKSLDTFRGYIKQSEQ